MDNSTREKASPLGVVAVEADVDVARFDAMLNAGHYLGARQPSGHTLRQAVVDGDGAWVAVALWCGGTYRLDPRDGHIGWDARKREERGALVTQLARFMVDGRRRGPNVASQALGAALRALPAQFRAKYGYAPALAESFSDPELHAGTLYLATNWTKLGLSKGFSRDYADYYVPNARPKALWVRPLRDDWRASLCATALPDGDAAALRPSRELPLDDAGVESLFGALMGLRDRRRSNRSVPQVSVLCAVALAMLCGHSSVSEFVRFAQGLTQEQKKLLGFPRLKRNRELCRAPSRKTFDTVLSNVSPSELAGALDRWYAKSLGDLPATLAADGKYVRDKAGTLNLCDPYGRTASSTPIKKKGRSRWSRGPRPASSGRSTAAP